MKKSVKSLLLALMVLCLSASAVFAAETLKGDHASADIYVDFTLPTDVKSIEVSPLELKFVSTDVASLGTTAASSFASADTTKIQTVSISYDKGATTPVKLTVALSTDVTMDATIDKMYVALSKDAKVPSEAQEITATSSAYTINLTEASNDWYVLVGLDISDDVGTSAKGAVLFQLKVWSYDLTPKETGDKKAFSSATFALTTTPTGEINPATFAATASATSKDFTISSDVTLISVDVTSSSDVLSFSKSGIIDAVTSNESNDKFALTVKVTSTVTSGSVTFKMASGDKSVDITLNFATSSSGSSEKTVEDVTSLDQTALETLSKDLESIGTDIVTYVSDLTSFITEEDAQITAVATTTSGIVVLTVTAGSNTYTAIPSVNGTIPVLVANDGTMSLPAKLTPANLAAQLKKITGSSELSDSDVTSFYTAVFTESFLENTTPKEPSEYGAEDPLLGGVSSFKATITNALPYGTIILVYLKPVDETSTTKYGAMVHSGTPGEESKDINFDLDDVQDTSGSAISEMSIPYTEEYTIGYSTPDAGGALSGGSVEDGSFEIAASATGERGSFGDVELTGAEKKTVDGSNKGSSSGCDAGFGALALLAIVPFIRKIRK